MLTLSRRFCPTSSRTTTTKLDSRSKLSSTQTKVFVFIGVLQHQDVEAFELVTDVKTALQIEATQKFLAKRGLFTRLSEQIHSCESISFGDNNKLFLEVMSIVTTRTIPVSSAAELQVDKLDNLHSQHLTSGSRLASSNLESRAPVEQMRRLSFSIFDDLKILAEVIDVSLQSNRQEVELKSTLECLCNMEVPLHSLLIRVQQGVDTASYAHEISGDRHSSTLDEDGLKAIHDCFEQLEVRFAVLSKRHKASQFMIDNCLNAVTSEIKRMMIMTGDEEGQSQQATDNLMVEQDLLSRCVRELEGFVKSQESFATSITECIMNSGLEHGIISSKSDISMVDGRSNSDRYRQTLAMDGQLTNSKGLILPTTSTLSAGISSGGSIPDWLRKKHKDSERVLFA